MLGVTAVREATRSWRGAGKRESLLGLAAALIVAGAVGVSVVEYPSALGSLHHRAAVNASQSQVDRLLAGAHSIDISRDFLRAARDLIPRNETFAVATGPNVAVSTPITLSGLPSYAQFWLLPRREESVDTAEWLLCYGCDPGPLRERLKTAWSDGHGLSIARIGR